ncbi:hypothetical protein KXV85_003690, partial [Aspergillus fumigatus]
QQPRAELVYKAAQHKNPGVGRQAHQQKADGQQAELDAQQALHRPTPDPRVDEGAQRNANAGDGGEKARPCRICHPEQGKTARGLNLHRVKEDRAIERDEHDDRHPLPREGFPAAVMGRCLGFIASGEGNPDRPIALADEGFCFRYYLSSATAQYYRPSRAGYKGGRACEAPEQLQVWQRQGAY